MKEKIRRYVKHLISKLVPYIRERYKIKNFEVASTISFDSRRVNSWGGVIGNKGYLSFAINRDACVDAKRDGVDMFEYADYKDHPYIGARCTNNWKFYIFRLVMHELAHCVELYPMRIEKRLKFHSKESILDNPPSEHGLLFQEIYIDLVENHWNFEKGII